MKRMQNPLHDEINLLKSIKIKIRVVLKLLFFSGYEIDGLENVPESEPAIIIYYHGAIPIDIYYFLAKVYLIRNRIVHTVADNFLFKFSGENF